MFERFKEKYIGDSQFYSHVLLIAVPMIIQNLITNFVSMLDNIMVGQIGTSQMSGVSIANQFVFVFNITIFGAVSGASIFGTQYYGKGDHEGQKYTFRFRLITAAVVIAIFSFVFYFFGNQLIGLYLNEGDSKEIIASTLKYGKDYLNIMIFGLIPFGIGQAYASVVRECGETRIPMIGSAAAIGINLVLDYGLIFGNLGMPKLGVVGAAVATVVAKYVEALVVIIWAHTHEAKNKYIIGLYRGFAIPGKLCLDIIKKGCPLLFNEFLWSMGVTVINQCYAYRGLTVVAASNIASTITNLFSVVYIQLGATIGIMIGNLLGADKIEEAKDSDRKLTFFSIFLSVVIALCIVPLAFVFPKIYNTEVDIKSLAAFFIITQAIALPIWSYTNACYFTLRSGGNTGITFLFDFIFSWFVQIPLAMILSRFTSLDIRIMYPIVTYAELFKGVVGYMLVKSGIWAKNIVKDSV